MDKMEAFEAAAVRWVATHASATHEQYRAAMKDLQNQHGISDDDASEIVYSKSYGPRRRPKRVS